MIAGKWLNHAVFCGGEYWVRTSDFYRVKGFWVSLKNPLDMVKMAYLCGFKALKGFD